MGEGQYLSLAEEGKQKKKGKQTFRGHAVSFAARKRKVRGSGVERTWKKKKEKGLALSSSPR